MSSTSIILILTILRSTRYFALVFKTIPNLQILFDSWLLGFIFFSEEFLIDPALIRK